MPAASIFPERRTRSQLTLPDTVLAIPDKSPLKIAKSRSTMTPKDRETVVEDSEGEDELMLSPGRRTMATIAEASKRSASPPPEDEYAQGSSDGRHLKRRKREAGGMGNIADTADSGLATPEVEPRRSTRPKFTPSHRKPVSTVSASPPATAAHSPAPINGRAQSVPLFASADDLPRTDLPRLDLAKLLQRSPKRKRSRSRSPVKDTEQKLRITNVGAAIPCRLPTIHDGVATGSGSLSDGESSVAEEREMEMPTPAAPPQSSSPVSPALGADDDVPSSSSPTVPAPATPATSDPVALDKTMPMSPLTPVPPTPFPPIRKRGAAYTKSRLGMLQVVGDDGEDDDDGVESQKSLKELVSGVASSSSSGTQQAGQESTSIAIGATYTTTTATVASSSRLPPSQSAPSTFTSTVPPPSPALPNSTSRTPGPSSTPSQPPGPGRNTHTTTNSTMKQQSAAGLPSSSSMPALALNPFKSLAASSSSKAKPAFAAPAAAARRTNAFDVLMAAGAKAQAQKDKGKGKATTGLPAAVRTSMPSSSLSSSLSSGVGPSFAPVVARGPAAVGVGADSGKVKLKDRMRKKMPREKEKEEVLVIEALPEEEEEEEKDEMGGGGMEKEEQARMDEERDGAEEQEEMGVEVDAQTQPRRSAQSPERREPGQDKPREEEDDAAAVVVDGGVSDAPVVDVDMNMDMADVPPVREPQEVREHSGVDDGSVGADADIAPAEAPREEDMAPEPVAQTEVEEGEGARTTSARSQQHQPQTEESLESARMDVEGGIEDVAMRQSGVEAEPVVGVKPVGVEGAGAGEVRGATNAAESAQEQEPEHQDEQQEQEDPDAPSAKQSKTSVVSAGKKRAPTAIPLPTRVTRSSSTRKQGAGDATQTVVAGPSRKPQPQPKVALKAPLKRTASGKVKIPEPAVASSSTSSSSRVPATGGDVKGKDRPRTPGSPMKLSTPKKAAPVLSKDAIAGGGDARGGARSTANTPVAKRARGSPSPRRPASSPSPMKVSRELPDYTPIRPLGITRTFSANQIFSRPGSSLSQLSSALQKLHQPAPARPSTSMGFNPDAGDETDNDNEPLTTKDDAALGQRKSIGLGRTGSSASQRSMTLDPDAFKSAASSSSTSTTTATIATAASSSLTRPTASSQAKLVQKRLPFGPGKAAAGAPRFGLGGTAAATRGRPVGASSKVRPLFGVGGGLRRTASKKSSLPVVIGSPVKGGSSSNAGVGDGGAAEGEEEEEEEGGEIFNTILNTGGSATTLLTNLLAQQPEKGKEKDAHKPASHSRRVSMLSRDLLEAATAPPPAPAPLPSSASQTAVGPVAGSSGSGSGGKGLMGPPPTPPSVASVKSTSDSGSPSTGAAKRSSARIAKTMAAAATAAAESSVAAGKRRAMDPPPLPNPAAEALQVLHECVIFVDVKTDEGDEAGTLFVDMLGTLGARVAAGVGQRCTHIVFKNGLSSTTNKYRALRDPKPHVVSIGWVVACAEQRRRVPEAEYLVDLEYANILGANKRRRASAFHKLLMDPTPDYSESAERGAEDATDEGDRSMDGSVSSITMEDDGLAPLERARRRKSMMIGLNN